MVSLLPFVTIDVVVSVVNVEVPPSGSSSTTVDVDVDVEVVPLFFPGEFVLGFAG